MPVRRSHATTVLPALLVMALGYGASFAPLYAAATDGLPVRLAGLGSGLITTAQQVGGALGLAILCGVGFTALPGAEDVPDEVWTTMKPVAIRCRASASRTR